MSFKKEGALSSKERARKRGRVIVNVDDENGVCVENKEREREREMMVLK